MSEPASRVAFPHCNAGTAPYSLCLSRSGAMSQPPITELELISFENYGQ